MKSFRIVVGVILFILGCGFTYLAGYTVSEINNVLGFLIAVVLLMLGGVLCNLGLYIKLIIR